VSKPALARGHAINSRSESTSCSIDSLLRAAQSALRATPLGRFDSFLKTQRQLASHTNAHVHSDVYVEDSKEGALVDVFPAHLPQRPSSLFSSSRIASRRRAARKLARRRAWLLVEQAWAVLNFVALGSPKSLPVIKRSLKTWHASTRKHVCFNRLLEEYLPFGRLEPLQALAKGRGLAKLHDLELILEQVSDVCSHEREVADLVAASSAMPVEVDKIKNQDSAKVWCLST